MGDVTVAPFTIYYGVYGWSTGPTRNLWPLWSLWLQQHYSTSSFAPNGQQLQILWLLEGFVTWMQTYVEMMMSLAVFLERTVFVWHSLHSHHPSWLPPSILCMLKKTTTALQKEMLPLNILGSNYISLKMHLNKLALYNNFSETRLHKSSNSGGGGGSAPASDPIFSDVLSLTIWCDEDCEGLTHWRQWLSVTWHFLVLVPLSHAFTHSPPTPLGSLSATSPPPLVLHNQAHLAYSGCYWWNQTKQISFFTEWFISCKT